MVAKLASLASKPDGIRVIDDTAALQQLLAATPASRLPRCGGKVADTLTRAGVHTVAELQASVSYLSCLGWQTQAALHTGPISMGVWLSRLSL